MVVNNSVDLSSVGVVPGFCEDDSPLPFVFRFCAGSATGAAPIRCSGGIVFSKASWTQECKEKQGLGASPCEAEAEGRSPCSKAENLGKPPAVLRSWSLL